MDRFPAKRRVFSHTMRLDATPSQVFPLLCPVREYEWIEVWDCTMVYSASGFAEEDCVFVFDIVPGQPPDTFVVSRYEKDEEIQFIRFNGIRTIRQSISLTENADGTTDATWTQVITGLSEKGNALVEGMTEEGYLREVGMIEKMLNHFLTTGEMLKISAVGGREALLGPGSERSA